MFDLKEAAKHLGIGALQHLGGWIAGGVIGLLSFFLTLFVSFGERSLTRADWVILTLGFALALTAMFCGIVWAYPRAVAIWREWRPKDQTQSASPNTGPQQLSLVEAATQAYEQTKGTTPAAFAEGSADPETRNEDIITWYCFYLAERLPIYGNQPPSRVSEKINWAAVGKRMNFRFRNGALRLIETFRDEQYYENLYVDEKDLKGAVEQLKALAEHVQTPGCSRSL
jgi:hypothetical protein